MHRTSVNIGLTTLITIQWRPLVWTETVMSLCWKQNTSSFNVHHVALSLLYYLHCIELLCKSINKTKDGIIIYPNNTTTADTPAFHIAYVYVFSSKQNTRTNHLFFFKSVRFQMISKQHWMYLPSIMPFCLQIWFLRVYAMTVKRTVRSTSSSC